MLCFVYIVNVLKEFPQTNDLYGPEMSFGYMIFIRSDQNVTLKYRLSYSDGTAYSNLIFNGPRANGTLTFYEDENQNVVSSIVDVTEQEHLCPPAEGVQQKCFSLKFRVRNIMSDVMMDLKFWVKQSPPCLIEVDYENFLLHPTAPSTDPLNTSTDPPRTNTNPLTDPPTDPPGTNALHSLFEKPAVQFTSSVLSILCLVFLGTTIIMPVIAYQCGKRQNCGCQRVIC